jgi:hypothetical protein
MNPNKEKHAYLLIVHSNLHQVNQLIKSLDFMYNDLFIHIDHKSKMRINEIYKPKFSNIYLYKSISVYWGHFSQIKVELFLLNKAYSTFNYQYYHLLSGQDLPIKPIYKIHDFFSASYPSEFVDLDTLPNSSVKHRINYYHFFTSFFRIRFFGTFLFFLNKFFIILQKKLNIYNHHPFRLIGKGSNWVSITRLLAKELLINKRQFLAYYKYSFCGDELFIQTYLLNNSHKFPHIKPNMRLIDWTRGSPHTFTSNDFNLILDSNALFARKFDISKDRNIVEKIISSIQNYQYNQTSL